MGLFDWVRRAPKDKRSIATLEDYSSALNQFMFNGQSYGYPIQQTLTGNSTERIPNDLTGYATAAYASNGALFALMAVRMLVFSAVRFQFQRFNQGRPSELFGTSGLSILETPWTGGTTQDLLARMSVDVDLAGNSYWAKLDGELIRLRPDWVEIVLEPRRLGGGIVGYKRIGYLYAEGGVHSGADVVPFLADEVTHFAPYPDPLATYRGMSWITPVIRELQNDKLMTSHQRKFFENGATPNMVVKTPEGLRKEQFEEFMDKFNASHRGASNAYKTLFLSPGTDVEVVGANFEEMSFTATQGRSESRMAAAAGVPPTIVGFSEGLQGSSLNSGNYSQARRRLADGTMHPLWANVAGSLQRLVDVPPGSRLWYDARDVPFLREDRKDAAEIQALKAQTVRTYSDAGFEPDAVIKAVDSEDMTLLLGQHSGLFSVQLQPPGTTATPIEEPATDDGADAQEDL